MQHIRIALLFLAVASVVVPAQAQINPFRNSSGRPLNRDDLAALNEATNRLLEHPQLEVGSVESWNNPRSGVEGTVTAGNPVTRRGMACRVVFYHLNIRNRDATLTWCRTPDGWRIA